MTVFQRLAQIARPYRGNLYTGIGLATIATFLETVVISSLMANLLSMIFPKNTFSPVAGATASHVATTPFIAWGSAQLAALQAWGVQLLSHVVNFNGSFQYKLITFSLVTLLVVFFKCLFQGRAGYLVLRFANLLGQDLRLRLFGSLVKQPPVFFEKERTGVQLTRITGDVSVLQQCVGPDLLQVVQSPMMIVFALLAMIFTSWRLTLTVICLAPLIAVAMSVAGKQIRKLVVSIQERSADLNAGLIERLANIRIIQSFVREPYETQHITDFNRHFYRETMRAVLLSETLSPLVEFIAWVGMVLGVLLGGMEVFRGNMSGESFLFFMLLAQRAGSQFKYLSRINQLRQQANGAGERILSTLDTEPEIRNLPDAQPLPHIEGHIVFDNVSFRYRSGGKVLSDITFHVKPGEVIALVGKSGSGKTTLVNLLTRFYDPVSGGISIDGLDLRKVTLESLREQVGIVPQETALFSGSIYENILYGKLDATMEEVTEAARSANALEFIERLQDGFDTIVGERGTRLSGGQRQRVAIARALLKNPRILILDEATSALDTESEHLVQQALDRLMLNRTTFVIAHRLSTVQDATRILVLDHGRIVESGSHGELLELDGVYARHYEMQFRTADITQHEPEAEEAIE